MTATQIFETPTVLSLVRRVQDDCAEVGRIDYANIERIPHQIVNSPLSAEFPGRYVLRLWFNRPEMEPNDKVIICPSLDGRASAPTARPHLAGARPD